MAGHTWYAILQYIGAPFAGWQRQPDRRTVQGEVEGALKRLTQSRVPVHAAGRTDTGVHALGQVVSFQLDRPWRPEDLARAVNALLPDDVWISQIGPAPAGFHARKHATARIYRYVIGCDQGACSPFRRPYEWALGVTLEPDLLSAAAARFRGDHDFRGLSAVGQTKAHYRCRVMVSQWDERPDAQGFIFTIEADRFLHRMVRFIVGLTVDVARGRRPLADIDRLLATTDNRDASPPAPPHGLYLVGVRYPHFDKDPGT